MAKSRLSNNSVYEQMFGTRHRGAGRPEGVDKEPLFPSEGRNPLLVRVAQRRAYAVVHEEQAARLREVFEIEMKVLQKRPVEEVARDVGAELVGAEESQLMHVVDEFVPADCLFAGIVEVD